MDVKRTFGMNLRRLRLAHGLTQEGLEGVSGFDRVYISGIERGVRNPTITAVALLAEALKVPISSFFEAIQPDKIA
jgi:transcriptional regulator with XRE-family HTH domain